MTRDKAISLRKALDKYVRRTYGTQASPDMQEYEWRDYFNWIILQKRKAVPLRKQKT
jgi:hypothetical protein